MNIRRHIIILALLFIATTGFAQVQTQKGVSYRYNGKNPRTPLPHVTIECVTANNAVVSDSTGSFTLTFNTLKMGDRMGLVTVQKREMMVFNQHAVDEWSIRKEPLCLILCDADEFEQQKKEYMELGRKDAKRRYDREKAELEKQLKEGKIKQEDLENALNVAYERLKKLQEEIDKYADDLARVDLSELDEKMQEILEMYQRGETEEAIERLKSLKLAEEFDKETAHNEAVQQELQQSDSNLQTLLEQMKSSVPLLMNSGEWEEAGKYLKRIADKMNNYDALFDYGSFCQKQNNYKEAEEYYQKALTIVRDLAQSDPVVYEPEKARVLNNLALVYSKTQHLTESEAMYLESLEISRRLAQSNPHAHTLLLAMTLHNLGLLYSNTQRFTESETLYLESLEIYRSMAKANPQAYEPYVGLALSNIGVMYENTQRFTESKAMYLEALVINRRLAQYDPQAYEIILARTLINLGYQYNNAHLLEESEAMYLEALEITSRLAQSNPQAYEPDLALTMLNLGLLYEDTQRLNESETMCNKALEIYRRLTQSDPQAYESDVVRSLISIGLINNSAQRSTESESAYMEALEISRRLTHSNPEAYEPLLAMTLINLANLFLDTQRYNEGEIKYLEAIEIYRRLAEANPQANEPNVAKALYCLATLYSDTQRPTESEAMYQEALDIYRRLARANPQIYEPDVAMTLYNIGLLHIKQEEYLKAIPVFEEALAIYRELAQNNPADENNLAFFLYWLVQLYSLTEEHAKYYEINEEWLPILRGWYQEDTESYQEDYIQALGNQSFQCIFVGQYEKSEQYAREALSIDSTQQWINTNFAATLLFQGKYDEAEAIYRQYKDELKESFLQDLQDFEAAGVIPEKRKSDVEKIKKILNK